MEGHQLWSGTSCGVAPAVEWHQLWSGTSCGGAPAVEWHQLWSGTKVAHNMIRIVTTIIKH